MIKGVLISKEDAPIIIKVSSTDEIRTLLTNEDKEDMISGLVHLGTNNFNLYTLRKNLNRAQYTTQENASIGKTYHNFIFTGKMFIVATDMSGNDLSDSFIAEWIIPYINTLETEVIVNLKKIIYSPKYIISTDAIAFNTSDRSPLIFGHYKFKPWKDRR
jgi:agmatine/peptidylarginine deiminase